MLQQAAWMHNVNVFSLKLNILLENANLLFKLQVTGHSSSDITI
jgi:hypothetical protein